MTDTPVNIGEQLGLGQHWVPGPATLEMKKVASSIGTMHVMILKTTAGVFAVALPPDDLRNWIAVMQQELTGLIIPPPGNGALG